MIAAANRNYPMRAAMLFRIRTPRTLTPEQIQVLKVLSAAVLGRLQPRRDLHSSKTCATPALASRDQPNLSSRLLGGT
jgi:hypothetical protein